eukprot:scaffold112932_cov26-Tisochrysis_lutea.AAC.1
MQHSRFTNTRCCSTVNSRVPGQGRVESYMRQDKTCAACTARPWGLRAWGDVSRGCGPSIGICGARGEYVGLNVTIRLDHRLASAKNAACQPINTIPHTTLEH